MSHEFKLIDADEAYAKLARHIERTKLQLAVVKQVIDSLRGMEGKNLNNHLSNKLVKYHPSQTFYISTVHSWYEMDIEGEGFDPVSLNLCYKSEPGVVNVKRIEELNQRYLLDEVRIPKYEAELLTVKERVKAYNDALLAFKAAHDGLGVKVTSPSRTTARRVSRNRMVTTCESRSHRVLHLPGRWLVAAAQVHERFALRGIRPGRRHDNAVP